MVGGFWSCARINELGFRSVRVFSVYAKENEKEKKKKKKKKKKVGRVIEKDWLNRTVGIDGVCFGLQ